MSANKVTASVMAVAFLPPVAKTRAGSLGVEAMDRNHLREPCRRFAAVEIQISRE